MMINIWKAQEVSRLMRFADLPYAKNQLYPQVLQLIQLLQSM
jgi:hypothetical protein